MTTQIRWLKASFLAGAVADGIAGILILIPSRMGETEFRYAMGLASSLMFGWALLLMWGYRKPVARKGILLITIFPVITGLIGTGAYQVATGAFSVTRALPSTIVAATLMALLGFSYFNARKLKGSGG